MKILSLVTLLIAACLIVHSVEAAKKKKKEPKVDVDVRQPPQISPGDLLNPTDVFLKNQDLQKEQQCNPDLPNLSVGNGNLTDKTIAKYKKDYSLFIIGMSNSECELCCSTESFLKMLKDDIRERGYIYKV